MDLMRFLAAIVWLEILARIAGPKDHGPYLLGLTMTEPVTGFEDALYGGLASED